MHIASGSRGRDGGVDLNPVGKGPCREGVDDPSKRGSIPGCLSRDPEAAIDLAIPVTSYGDDPDWHDGPSSDRVGQDMWQVGRQSNDDGPAVLRLETVQVIFAEQALIGDDHRLHRTRVHRA